MLRTPRTTERRTTQLLGTSLSSGSTRRRRGGGGGGNTFLLVPARDGQAHPLPACPPALRSPPFQSLVAVVAGAPDGRLSVLLLGQRCRKFVSGLCLVGFSQQEQYCSWDHRGISENTSENEDGKLAIFHNVTTWELYLKVGRLVFAPSTPHSFPSLLLLPFRRKIAAPTIDGHDQHGQFRRPL